MFDFHQSIWLMKPLSVMGRHLHDLTVGHVFLLEAMDSPFFCGGILHEEDVLVASLICTMSFDEAKAIMMDTKRLVKKCEWWGFFCRIKGIKIEDEVPKLRDYITSYTAFAEPWVDKDKPVKKSAIPFSVRLAWLLMDRMSEHEAWNLPMCRAMAYYEAFCEANGVEFLSQDQDNVIKGMHDGDSNS